METISHGKNQRAVIAVDKDKCVNCYVCIDVCPSKMCNSGAGDYVEVNADLCIGCGACIKACTHGARKGLDDFDVFMEDLKAGKKIIAIVAPAVAVTFRGKDLELNTWLKSIGVKAVFDVSFGAELTTKSYVEYIKKNNPPLVISQPCPALVSFIETYHPNLIPYLAPADSPMLHTMKMVKEFYKEYKDCKIVAVSPCFAKRREFDDTGFGDYNVAMATIDSYLKANKIDLGKLKKTPYDNPEAERAVLYSTPGGLMRTAERFVPGISEKIRKIEGQPHMAEYLENLDKDMQKGQMPVFPIIDCLNCQKGCNGGAATNTSGMTLDEMERYVEQRKKEREHSLVTDKKIGKAKLDSTINKYWKADLYKRSYIDKSGVYKSMVKEPTQADIESIYKSMGKTSAKDIMDCGHCGYRSCREMAKSIFNGFNKPENCHHYLALVFQKTKEEKEAEIREVISKMTSESIGKINMNDENVTRIKEAASQMSSNVNSSSSAIEQMIANISSINTILSENEKSISSLVDATDQDNTSIKEVNELVNKIEEKSGVLSEMSSVIMQISTRTNLLAMNAAIEAAHAGEAGKGFAVFASEIRKLADSSGREAKNIDEVLKNIQELINGTYEKAVKAQAEINYIVKLSDKVSEQEGIAKTAISEQNEGSQIVLSALKDIKDSTNNVENTIEELKTTFETIKSSIKNMEID